MSASMSAAGAWPAAAALLLGSLALRGDPPAAPDTEPRQARGSGRLSLQATTALVIAGLVLYIPANVLPVLQIERYGSIENRHHSGRRAWNWCTMTCGRWR